MYKKIISLVLLISAFSCSAASAQTEDDFKNNYHNRRVPKLAVQIIVSQMRYDYMYRFNKNYSDGGFKKILNEGVNCTNARYGYMFTHSSPGIVTIMTGTQPSQHGIIGDGWINYTTNEKISAIHDTRYEGVGCNEDEGQYSPFYLSVSGVGDELKRNNHLSKVVSVSQEPNGAVLSGGERPDGAYWFDERYGGWVTSTYYKTKLPEWVVKFNESDRKSDYSGRLWHISVPMDNYVYKQNTAILMDSVVKFSFDMLFKSKNNNNFTRIKETPYINSYLKDFAIEVIKNDSLGKDDIPDLLTINMSAQKYISENYGIQSTETEDSFYRLDKDIEEIIDYLDNNIGRDNYVMVITSDRGTSDNIRKDESSIASGKFNAMQFKVLISGFLNTQLGVDNWVSEYRNRQIYLNRRLVYEKGLSLVDIQNKVAAFALQFKGVAHAITGTTLQTNYYGKGIMSKIQNSFFPKHSGDIIINLLPGWIELEGEDQDWVMSSSGSPYEYDTHIPLVWYGGCFTKKTVHTHIDMINIAPTLCEILGIPHPNACEGEPIKEIITELR